MTHGNFVDMDGSPLKFKSHKRKYMKCDGKVITNRFAFLEVNTSAGKDK